MQQTESYIGLMSGTSMDSMDAVLVDFNSSFPKLLAHVSLPLELSLKESLLALNYSGDNELDRMAEADVAVAMLSARAVNQLLAEAGISANEVRAIGSHGQTIRHWPEQGNTLQIGSPSHIAEATNITTVADFRRRDMAAGGQGAPLAPAFHQAVFSSKTRNRVIVNIGGMSNITVLSSAPSSPVIGFDSGPGNVLLDYWIKSCLDKDYDDKGEWAASGTISESLLAELLEDPYFKKMPPKSTGRHYFNPMWLKMFLEKPKNALELNDIQATLAELTARTIAQDIIKFSNQCNEVIICGGGAFNTYLMSRIKRGLNRDIEVKSSDDLGVSPNHVEAMAFAWFAYQTMHARPSNMPEVTHAKGKRILGGIYLAS